ncbi:hypothetical protein TRFO_09675 [Tritrichomonas foetus]|uniref:UBX domain-containing protein n=1 Tax=Tritrichomonas foetus TaxID=1144522 RepID=A0A1J4JEL7_9EUKA|nr:hypothetical protein TRFO_09675 [Tritrichomonas foetus]|eukprot:OHS97105.1 hypothetical protein TRFO_09675 [Tritrichomonas foetus]
MANQGKMRPNIKNLKMNDNFRFSAFGQDEEDIMTIMSQRRADPTLIVVISLEEDNDYQAAQFWINQHVKNLLSTKNTKVIRIRKGANQTAFNQFNELYNIQTLPALYVFGPSSAGPSFFYVGNFPQFDEFSQKFSALNYNPTPVFQQPPPTPPPQLFDDEPRNRHASPSPPAPSNTFIEPDPPKPKHKPKPAPKPVEKPTPKPPVDVSVTMTTPEKKVHSNTFLSTDNCITVRVWASKILGIPHTSYRLIVVPGNYQLPFSDKVFLHQYAPSLQLQVVYMTDGKKPPKEGIFSQFFASISDFLSDISIFADKDDDPADFWRKEPVQRNIRRQPGRAQPPNQNHNQNQRMEGNVRRFRFTDGDDDQAYGNGNNTQFQQ